LTFFIKLIQRWRSRGLRLSLGVAVTAGMMVPVIVGMTLLAELRGRQIDSELEADLKGKVSILASSLVSPVWNFDTKKVSELSETIMLDPQVVRITITDPAKKTILNIEHQERRLGKSHSASQDLVLIGEVSRSQELAGRVEVELDDGLRHKEFFDDLISYIVILLSQFFLSLALVLIALHLRILSPLARLTLFSKQLAEGEFDRSIFWQRADEIGLLARQMDDMRNKLKIAFSEQHAILSNVQVGVVFVREHTIQLANRHAEKIFGYEPQALTNRPLREVLQLDDQFGAARQCILSNNVLTNGPYEETLLLRRVDDSVFWAHLRCSDLDSSHPGAGKIWVIEDISDRKAAEEEINRLAFYDSLTSLPNRRLLLERLNRALISCTRSDKIGALLFIDLDEFKTFNDTQGHEKGDLLLKEVSKLLLNSVRKDDTVARLGGDEFVVILEDLGENREEVARCCEVIGGEISSALSCSIMLNGREVCITPSIGVTLFEGPYNRIDDLLKQADLAMYQAKAAGRNTLRFFDVAMQAIVDHRAALEIELREAVRQHQFVLHFQPQISGDGQITGAEVLVRWQHPLRGLLSPSEFIPIAEEIGLIVPLGNWVLETACQQLSVWAAHADTALLSIAVNVSAKQFHQSDFSDHVLTALKRTGANPTLLKLELTESHLVTNIETTIGKMAQLKAYGVGFSLDDFGTGYSSLAYLKKLPLDQLKIDQGFVRDILVDSNDAAIAKMIVALAATLGLTVIAEGVETQEQRDFLAAEGCYSYQGYYYSRPLPLVDFETYVRQYAIVAR